MPDAVIDALVKRLTAMYGERWLAMWVNVPMDEVKRVWAEELADVSPQSMKHALDHMDSAFPPSLPEFRALCRQFRSRGVGNVTLLDGPRQKVGRETFVRLQNIIKPRPKDGAA